jgi:hypothetical protein
MKQVSILRRRLEIWIDIKITGPSVTIQNPAARIVVRNQQKDK